MKYALLRPLTLIVFPIVLSGSMVKQNADPDHGLQNLLSAYPDFIARITANSIVFKDGSIMKYDDGIENKPWEQLLSAPSLKDQFRFDYVKGPPAHVPGKNEDPGRIRNEAFFKKMYGNTESEVKKELVEITWLPRTAPQKLWITKVNKVNEKLVAISNE